MKKLESISGFDSEKLNDTQLSSIFGGKTEGGSWCADGTSTGCRGYTHDSVGSDGQTTYHGIYELEAEC